MDFAQLVKGYGRDDNPETERRYSPSSTVNSTMRQVSGRPDPKHVSTSYVERHNLSVWMSVRRFARMTNAYSKRLINHAHHVALYAVWYNFCRIHSALRCRRRCRLVWPASCGISTGSWI